MRAWIVTGAAACALASGALSAPSAQPAVGTGDRPTMHRSLTLEDRIVAQRAIEQVYWSHRIWPKDNPSPKPSLGAVMSDAEIRAKVDDYLRKSNALEAVWRRAMTAHDLQAELDRMARESRDRRTLRELFEALGNDPFVIAETLVRETLAERLVRKRYAADGRSQQAARAKAEAALAACRDASCMKTMGGIYAETTVKLDRGGPPATDRAVRLGAAEWRGYIDRLEAALGTPESSAPSGRLGALEETSDAFAVRTVLSRRDGELTTAVVSWPKRSFDDWWRSTRLALEPDAGVDRASYTLPTLDAGACTNDTWTSAQDKVPDRRYDHVAVWTGSEMIVWGGTDDYGPAKTGGRYDPVTDTWTPTSIGAATPTPTTYGSVVWTGTEMIVWGGYDYSAGIHYVNTGARYDPAADSWAPTSTGTNVPSARSNHSAVWTGTEMIVWGGIAGYPPKADGGRYDPVTDRWTPVSTGPNSPIARSGHSAVWTGSEMIVWGGNNNGVTRNDGGRYDPGTDAWAPLSTGTNDPAARQYHVAVWTGSAMIVWGGQDSGGTPLSTGGRYDPGTDSWQPTKSGFGGPPAAVDARAIWTGSRMILWGGSVGGVSAVAQIYDPVADTWTLSSDSPLGVRTHHTVVWTGAEMIVWGGQSGTDLSDGGARYDPSSDAWTRTSIGVTLPSARERATAVWTGTEMIVWGGEAAPTFPESLLNSGDRYTPATDTWMPTSMGGGVPDPRVLHTAVWTGREMIVWGGDGPGGGSAAMNTGGRYDPLSDAWTATSTGADVPDARGGHLAVWTGREMIVFGGGLNTGGRYDPTADAWAPTSTGANVPSGSKAMSAVWTGSRMIVWTGGFGPGGSYDPPTDSWTPVASGSNVLGTRYDSATVWSGTQMIIWGGWNPQSGSVLDTGGRYDPVTDAWTATSSGINVPSARQYHSAVWTGSEMLVWGGATNDASTNDGGRYDPVTDGWLPVAVDDSTPFPRYDHTAVWTGTQMIVWGGVPGTATGGLYCACPCGRILYRDADGDGYGDAAVSTPSCDGSIPAGYAAEAGDCDDANAAVHPGAIEVCDGLDNDCNGLVDEDASGEDSDGDGVHNLCDDCVFRFDPGQSDFDHDGEGDACDLNDGLIFVFGPDDATAIRWQPESGYTSWNVYEGDLEVLRTTGEYTQAPGSNPQAERLCGLTGTTAADPEIPPAGHVTFDLVTGVASGVESDLGTDSAGNPRPNTNPCP